MPATHFLLRQLSVLGEGCDALLTRVHWCVAYFISPNKINFSPFCSISYQIESFVFTCCLVSFQEFFSSWDQSRHPGFSGLWPAPVQGRGFPPFPSQYCPASCRALSLATPADSAAWHWRPPLVSGRSCALARLHRSCMLSHAQWRRKPKAMKEWVPFGPWLSGLSRWEHVGESQDTACVTCQVVDCICILGGCPSECYPKLV